MIAAHVHTHPVGPAGVSWVLLLPFAVALVCYLGAAAAQGRRGRPWPQWRSVVWTLGIVTASAAFAGPMASAAHAGFVGHVVAHVAVGMVAPLLLVLAAPVTLALRTMTPVPARRLSRILRSPPVRVVSHPLAAAALNVGGMWALYLTGLRALADVPLVHLAVMVHFLLAGYLFTAAILCVDPSPHRSSLRMRMLVLLLALAAHGILAKLLYADPPPGTEVADVRAGAELMYYAGDAVDLVLIALLCAQWYRANARRRAREDQQGREQRGRERDARASQVH